MKKILIVLFSLLLLCACPSRREDKSKPLPTAFQQKVELSQVDFDELEGWNNDKLDDFVEVFRLNCKKIMSLQTPLLYASEIKISTKDYQKVCQKFADLSIANGENLKLFLQENFIPYLVQADGNAEGKFTSYFESQIFASRTKHGKYVYPIYGKPSDLIEINLKDFDDQLPIRRLLGKINN